MTTRLAGTWNPYTIIEALSVRELKDAVNQLMESGGRYVPTGGVSVVSTSEGVLRYHQAMVATQVDE